MGKLKKMCTNINYCCFTGHREIGHPIEELRALVYGEIVNAVNNGYTHFVSGAALGFDLLCAEQVIKVKEINKRVKLEIAIPCTDHSKKWNQAQKNRLDEILQVADKITYVSKTTYYDGCMQVRNEYMVDKSSRVIAYYTGRPSGTKNTIRYAQKKSVDIIYLVDV